jgi:hypothetical protein
MTIKKQPAPSHRVERRTDSDNNLVELLIWFGDTCIFHLKRMSDGLIWFVTYIDGSNDVEIKSTEAIAIMLGPGSAPGPARRLKPKPEKSEETKPAPDAGTVSKSDT